MHSVVESLSAQAAVIEREKLKAVGQRNVVQGERETRRRKVRETQALVDERVAELARLQAEYESLLRVELEQQEVISRLSSNEGAGSL